MPFAQLIGFKSKLCKPQPPNRLLGLHKFRNCRPIPVTFVVKAFQGCLISGEGCDTTGVIRCNDEGFSLGVSISSTGFVRIRTTLSQPS